MDTIKVHVQKSHPVFADSVDYNYLILNDAEVYLALLDGENQLLSFDDNQKQYVLPGSKFQIAEGETYVLTVLHKDFKDAVAQTTIPFTHTNFEVTRIDSTIYSYDKFYTIETFIHDTPSVQNFYILYGFLIGEEFSESEITSDNFFSLRIFYFDELISDERLDGTAIPKNGQVRLPLESKAIKLHFQLFSIDRHFFAYRQSILDLDNLDSDPFATPAKMYSNFSNGHGVFAGYSIYTHEVSLVGE